MRLERPVLFLCFSPGPAPAFRKSFHCFSAVEKKYMYIREQICIGMLSEESREGDKCRDLPLAAS